MKRLLIVVFILFTISSYGGDSKKMKSFHPEMKFGAEAGLNIANIIYHFSNSLPSDFTFIWHAGAYTCISFNEKFSLQPELLYSVKGTTNPIATPANTIHLNYIEVPLLVKYNIGKGFNIVGGPYVGFLLNFTSSFSNTVYSNSKTPDGGVNTFDVGTVAGLEHQWTNGFIIGVKYVQGLYDIYPRTVSGYPKDLIVPANNLVFSLYVGWTFLKF